MRKFLSTGIVSLALWASAQELTLTWDLLAVPRLELYVYHTDPAGRATRIEAEAEPRPTLGVYRASLPLREGRYQVFVANPDADNDFADWSSYTWVDYVKLSYRRDHVNVEVQPRPSAGGLWHALDLLGEFQDPVIVNQILPRRLVVFGQVFSAETGVPLAQVSVRAQNERSLLIRDVTNRRGLFLLFLPEDSYQLTFEGARLVPRDAFVDLRAYPFPHRLDTTLIPAIERSEQVIVLNWDLYPNDLQMELVSEEAVISAEVPSPDSAYKRIRFVPQDGRDWVLVVRPTQEADKLLFAYSQARVTVHNGTEVISRQLPLGNRSAWTVLRYTPAMGWIDPEP